MSIYISGINKESIVDGPGIRYVIYTQGCAHFCKGCHNPGTHSFSDGGYYMNADMLLNEIESNPLVKGVTFSGGDPIYQSSAITPLARELRKRDYNLWLYTGFLWHEVKNNSLTPLLDVVVDGPFVEKEKSMELNFCGSRNQRLIDVQKTIKLGDVVLHELDYRMCK